MAALLKQEGSLLKMSVLLSVYKDGRVCISILHNPGEDPTGYEDASERWSPVHTVSSVVLQSTNMLRLVD